MGIFTASVFLSNEVGELATKYQAWHKLTANKNQSAGRPASQITTECARISFHRESRQGRPCMANDLDPRNKANQLQNVHHGGEGSQKCSIRV
jgi:hypothetical protein